MTDQTNEDMLELQNRFNYFISNTFGNDVKFIQFLKKEEEDIFNYAINYHNVEDCVFIDKAFSPTYFNEINSKALYMKGNANLNNFWETVEFLLRKA